MLTLLLLGLWGLMLAGRETPIGRALYRWMVEFPCRRIAAIQRGQVLLMIVMLAIITGLVWGLENDGRMLVTMGWPEFMAFASAVDLSALLDLAAVAVVSATMVRVRGLRVFLARRGAGFARSMRRAGRVRRPNRPGGRDEDRPMPVPRFA